MLCLTVCFFSTNKWQRQPQAKEVLFLPLKYSSQQTILSTSKKETLKIAIQAIRGVVARNSITEICSKCKYTFAIGRVLFLLCSTPYSCVFYEGNGITMVLAAMKKMRFNLGAKEKEFFLGGELFFQNLPFFPCFSPYFSSIFIS